MRKTEGREFVELYDGYAGSILEIDLTQQRGSRISLPVQYRTRLLSGKSLAAQIMTDRMTGREAALSEENIVVVASSLLTGTGAPGAARFDVASLSPKDNLPAFSNCGGNFGLYLKRAGYDALVLKGRCERPKWLQISADGVIFHDAADLWGLGTGACREQLQKNQGKQPFGSVCIGPAGEHLVKFASLLADKHSTGRAGLGAVLGWKRLKAITVTGEKTIPFYEESAVSEINRWWYAHLREVASQRLNTESCTACPLHCVRHSRGGNPILEELGMDAIAAEAVTRDIEDPDIFRAIAFREGIGDQLAEGVKTAKGKFGKRRNICCARILETFGFGEDADDLCKNMTEAVCVLGQCLFTVNGLVSGMKEMHLLTMMNSITGRQLTLEDLLAIGRHSRELEEAIRKRFEPKNTSA